MYAAAAANLASSLGQSISGAIDSSIQYGFNAKSASTAWDRWKNAQTRGPTYAMQGLRAAGLNPILAAGGSGFSGTPARAPQAAGVGRSGGPASFQQNQLLQGQSALLEKQATLTDQQTATASALEQKYKSETGKVNQDVYIASLGVPEKEVLANYINSGPGARIVKRIFEKGAVPDTLTQLFARGAAAIANDPELRAEIKAMIHSSPSSVRSILFNLLFGGPNDAY